MQLEPAPKSRRQYGLPLISTLLPVVLTLCLAEDQIWGAGAPPEPAVSAQEATNRFAANILAELDRKEPGSVIAPALELAANGIG